MTYVKWNDHHMTVDWTWSCKC